MGNYTEIFHHFVWATKRREPFLTPRIEPIVHDYIRCRCEEMRVTVHAINGMPDHIHLACSLPLSLAASDFLQAVKGGSGHYINHRPDLQNDMSTCLYWNPGVGAITYASRDLSRVVRYIDDQKRRHAKGRLSTKLERCDDDYTRAISAAPEGLLSD